uniref:Integrin beta n=1 Tax=Paramormyrops kingsleyae TaxID=1676925 RepID=A0A3B3SYU2_9TELE
MSLIPILRAALNLEYRICLRTPHRHTQSHNSVVCVFSPPAQSQESCVKTVVRSCAECIKSGPYCAWCKLGKDSSYLFHRLLMETCSSTSRDDMTRLFSQSNGGVTHMSVCAAGFGSFVDKVVLPYTSTNPKRVQKPCPDNERFCQPAFGYKHVLSMTDNEILFNKRVSEQAISGNLDVPEGGLDAIILLSTPLCDKIGWGNSTRLLVFTTDAGFHMAGDGKLAAILEPNDGRCHLDAKMLYSKSSEMDYPSVGQVMQKLVENNIQPIFAVTKDVEPRLKDIIPKSEVGVLTSDSSNVISLIQNAYRNLSSNVIVTHDDLPDHVTVMYTSNCPNGDLPSIRGTCDNVGIGKEVEFNVTVTAHKCLNEQSFLIGPLGFREKIRVNLTTRCECECDDRKDSNHQHCNSQGQVSCGTCSCNKGFVGQKCECKIGDKSEAELRQACMPVNGSMCSGQGECVCGVCHCSPGEDGRSIYGRFCECDDRSCPLSRGQPCGGRGRCSCGTCNCNPGYEGDACDCRKSDNRCRTGNKVCYGRGNCVCDVCNCTVGYTRPFCETCPGCPALCERVASCVECHMDERKGNCLVCQGVTYREEPDLKEQRLCKRRGTDGCQMIYSTKQLQADSVCISECPEPPDLRLIIGGTFSGVALIGILLLLALKAFIHMRDLKEFRRFENEQKKSKWNNPLFKTATTTVQNPNFGGD